MTKPYLSNIFDDHLYENKWLYALQVLYIYLTTTVQSVVNTFNVDTNINRISAWIYEPNASKIFHSQLRDMKKFMVVIVACYTLHLILSILLINCLFKRLPWLIFEWSPWWNDWIDDVHMNSLIMRCNRKATKQCQTSLLERFSDLFQRYSRASYSRCYSRPIPCESN